MENRVVFVRVFRVVRGKKLHFEPFALFLRKINRNTFRAKTYISRRGLFNQVQSSLIKANQVIFQTQMPANPSSRQRKATAEALPSFAIRGHPSQSRQIKANQGKKNNFFISTCQKMATSKDGRGPSGS